MDFIDEVRAVSRQFEKVAQHWKNTQPTEEATKTSLVLPFIKMLGYDFHNPTEVVPEFTAGFGSKKTKVDYAIMNDGQPVIIIEAKKYGTPLQYEQEGQLSYYFLSRPTVRFGILTNGVGYRFYSDIEERKEMDRKPFLELDILDINDDQIAQLKQFHKKEFDQQKAIEAAREFKYTNRVMDVLAEEMESPCDDFIKFVLGRIGLPKSKKFVTQFGPLVRSAFTQYVRGLIDAGPKAVKYQSEGETKPEPPPVVPWPDASLYLNTTKGVRAEGRQEENGFVVLAGSLVLRRTTPSIPLVLAKLRNAMAVDGRLADNGPDFWRLTQDHKFRSPSGAASFLLGFGVNGKIRWKDSEGRTLKALLG